METGRSTRIAKTAICMRSARSRFSRIRSCSSWQLARRILPLRWAATERSTLKTPGTCLLLDNNHVGLESVIFFETPQEIFARVFSELKPRTAPPAIRVEFRQFANANSFIQWDESGLEIRITDVLDGAPAQILEALAHILLSKLLRRRAPRTYAERYRRYLNRKEMRRTLELVKQTRGRKFVSGPMGSFYDLQEIF